MTYIDKKNFNIYYDVSDVRIKSSLFEIDEFLAPVISILNKKGYKTSYCCSGHLNNVEYGDGCGRIPNDNCYIVFKKYHNILNDVPIGFEIEHNGNPFNKSITIRKWYKQEDRFIEIMDTMKDLYLWVKELPIVTS